MYIKPQIAVLKDSAPTEKKAELIDLARRLNLPLIDAPDAKFSYVLTFRDARLGLHCLSHKRSPLVVDFLSGPPPLSLLT